MDKRFKVRDLRKKEQFIIDDAYLNGYAKFFRPNGTAIYISLCRRADKEQSCFPSEKTIAKDHNITDRTVRKYIKRLKQANIIRIKKERSKSGKWYNNVYYLIDKSEWKTPEEINSSGIQRNIDARPEENNSKNKRNLVPPKDTHKKDTHKKDILKKLEKMKEAKEKVIRKKTLPSKIRTEAQEEAAKEERRLRRGNY